MTRIYLIDTCYLLELYRVPGFSTEQHYPHILERMKRAAAANAIFFVTLPCIIEVANHLADSNNKQQSLEIGRKVLSDVTTSISDHVPWQVTPSYDSVEAFQAALSFFLSDLLLSGVGLCDAFTMKEAEKLAAKYSDKAYNVHIMTLDTALKAREPHVDPDPYTGS